MGASDDQFRMRAMRLDPDDLIADRAPPGDYWVDDQDAQQSRWLQQGELAESFVDNNITGWHLRLDPFAHAAALDDGELFLFYSNGASLQLRFGDIDVDGGTTVDHYRRANTLLYAVDSSGRDVFDAYATPDIVGLRREMIEAVVAAGRDRLKWAAMVSTVMAGRQGAFELAMAAQAYLDEQGEN